MLGGREIDRTAIGALQQHVVQPGIGVGAAGDLIGSLVHHLEAHVLEHGHALGERDRPLVAPHLESDCTALARGATVKIDTERAACRQSLDEPDVGHCRERRIVFAVPVRESIAITFEQGARPRRIMHRCELVAELVGPGAHHRLDRPLQAEAIRCRRLTFEPRDDEMDPDQRSLGKERIEGADASLVDLGEVAADRLAHAAVVTLARHEHQHRDEAIEPVAARQHSHSRPFVELQHQQRELIERILVDLEQFVARVILQHVDQCLAGMSLRIEAGAVHDRVDLASQVGNRTGRLRIGGGGEQAGDADLADEHAVGIEALDPDIVHMHAPVHARADVGLGDDEQFRLAQEREDFRREFEQLRPAAQDLHFRRAQHSQPGAGNRLQRAVVARDGVAARAQKSEIVGGEPFQERNRLGDLVDRQRRRIGLELGDRLGDARRHRTPVLDRGADIGESQLDPLHDLRASRLLVDARNMDVDEALSQQAGAGGSGALEGGKPAGGIAGDAEYGVHDQADIDAALAQLCQNRIDQERHVVIDDLEHGFALPPFRADTGFEGLETDLRRPRFSHGHERPGARRQPGELTRVVTHDVFGRREGEKPGDEILRHLAIVASEDLAGRCDERGFGALFIAARKDLPWSTSAAPAAPFGERSCCKFFPSRQRRRGQKLGRTSRG